MALRDTIQHVDLGRGIVAGFTTRLGGASPPPWESFNLGLNVGDDPQRVAAHRNLLADEVGSPLVFMKQVHGAEVTYVSGSTPPGDGTGHGDPECDALVTDADEVGLVVQVADCVPVLLADSDRGVIGVAHAGRAGVVAGVVAATVAALRDLGAARLRAVIGPSICGACYEVPAAMRSDVAAVCRPAFSQTRSGTPALDLPAAVAAQLAAGGVRDVERLEQCTYEHDAFYSHRLSHHDAAGVTGRFAGYIARPR